MAEYRIYLLDEQGSLHSPEELEVENDQQAFGREPKRSSFG
jgi:hypothetical protein